MVVKHWDTRLLRGGRMPGRRALRYAACDLIEEAIDGGCAPGEVSVSPVYKMENGEVVLIGGKPVVERTADDVWVEVVGERMAV